MTVPSEMAPGQFIEKVSLVTGDALDEAIEPEELLVQHHRDYHIVDTYARSMMSWLVKRTGSEDQARKTMKKVQELGFKTADLLAKATGADPAKLSRSLFGLKRREYYFRFKRQTHHSDAIAERLAELRRQAESQLKRCQGRTRVLLTGGTGFVGKEILWQSASIPHIEEMVVLIRPKVIKNRLTGEIKSVISVAERGRELLSELGLRTPEEQARFRFIEGDIEQPRLGVADADFETLKSTITHVIHCAASVAFDDPYPESFRANVLGSQNALDFSYQLQTAPDSPFVAHLSVETSYIHGRQVYYNQAREDEIVFPRNFYNNYYELTKALASLETETFMLEKGLRVVQLCPAIVIGESRAGNNRGDMKVVNAPVNAFGRARKAIKESRGDWVRWSQAQVLYRMACIFPGDPSAQLNLIPVDWVAQGILAALVHAAAVGERIHLATDNRITAEHMRAIMKEELRVDVKLAEPTVHRTFQLPVLAGLLTGLKQQRLAKALKKLGTIFGGYSEWGQTVHQVGNDVTILGMSEPRPNTEYCFRMLCRHNKYVQEFGDVRDPAEIARREEVWKAFIQEMEDLTGEPVGAMPANDFVAHFNHRIDRDSFTLRPPP